jgi:flagellar hook-basal body protein
MSKTTITMNTKANETPSNNIAAKDSWGHKKRENLFFDSFVGTSTGGISYVNSKTRSTNDQQGTIINTGVPSDIGIDGAGLLVVSDRPDGVMKYTRRGDFRQDRLGYWQNGAGQLLRAWRLDNEGNLPQNSSLLSSLEPINFANIKGLPIQTTVVSIAMNLNADKNALRGGGPVDGFIMQRSGKNKTTKADTILLPDQINNKALRIGDSFTFSSSDGEGERKITYGGIVVGKKASITSAIFGASSGNSPFRFSGAAGIGNIVDGQGLRIAVGGGTTYSFTAMSGQASNNNFNSLQTLADAINKTSLLHARVVDDRIYIAPKDANKSLSFSDIGGGNIVETLGLSNLLQANALQDEVRFNSIRTMRDAVNRNQKIYSLLGTIDPQDNIKITSQTSTSSFKVKNDQVDGNKITRAITNPSNNAITAGSVFIESRDSGLQAGDFVRISNINDVRLPDGVYVVGTADSNGFTINIVGGAAAYNMAKSDLVVPANATWQIATGRKEMLKPSTITGASVGGAIEITCNAHGYANGDVIYTDGGVFELNIADVGGGGVANKTITLPAGYYTVANSAPNTFRITPTGVAGAGGGAGANAVSFRKVGNNGGGVPGEFDTTVFTTGAAGSTLVNYHIGSDSHGYAVGGKIRFKNVGGAFDGITLAPNVDYTITAVNAGIITFDVAGSNPPAGTANVGAQAIVLSAQGNVRFDNYSRLFEYFGLDPEKDNVNYEQTYDPINIDKNLAGGNFKTSEVFSYPITVRKSNGSTSTFLMHFAKIENNKWAVELSTQRDKNGLFDVDDDSLAATNGVIKYGTLLFNDDGKLNVGAIEGFDEPINIGWKDGSKRSSITIDFPNNLSEITSGSVSQTKNPDNVEIVQGNGQGAGTLLKLDIDPDGFVVGTFDSGKTRKLYQIPIAVFANVNGLIAGPNGTYEISRESGELLLKSAGVGGAGKTLGGTLEASNADVVEELLRVREMGTTVQANARVAAAQFKNISTVLNELNQ